jgi:hypothetical protein
MPLKFIVVFIFLLVAKSDLIGQQDSSWHSELPTIEVKEDRFSINEPSLTLLKKEFKTTPAAFQDPIRMLNRKPGFAIAHDGANYLIHRGLPSEAFVWQLEGVRTVNPNHLSNAGTINDLPIYNAGGTLGLTATSIGTYSFDGNPTNIANSSSWGGASNINVSQAIKSYYELSLLGFEAGLNISKNNKNHYVSIRNSFVGLLGALGVDFGGEKINFFDFNMKSDLVKTSKHQLSFIAIGGVSTNKFEHIPIAQNDTITSKNIDDIKYNGKFGIGLLRYQYHFKKLTFTSTLSSSTRTDNYARNRANEYLFLGSLSNIDLNLTENIYFSNHSHLQYISENHKWIAGVRLMSQEIKRKLNNYFPNISRTTSLPYISYSYENKNEDNNFGLTLGVAYSSFRKKCNVQLAFLKQFGPYFELDGKAALSHPDLIGFYLPTDNFQTLSSELSLKSNFKKFTLGVKPFYQKLNKMGIYPIANRLIFVPVNGINPFLFSQDNKPIDQTDAYQQGVEVEVKKHFDLERHAIELFTNVTLFDVKYVHFSTLYAPSRYNYGFMYNAGLSYAYTFQKPRKYLNVSVTYHQRGGERLADENLVYNMTLSNYNRVDTRISYYYPSKRGKNHRWSLDVQNLFQTKNEADIVYDFIKNSQVVVYQLGFIPVLSYRYEL